MPGWRCLGLALGLALTAAPVRAQDARPAPIVHAVIGYAALLDDGGSIPHSAFGGGARLFVTSRVSIGPELVYMRGPGRDRDFLVTGTATVDVRADRLDGRARRIVPYIVANAGVSRVSGLAFLPGDETAVVVPVLLAGGGVRIAVGTLFVAPEYRVGFELQTRFSVSVGWRPAGAD